MWRATSSPTTTAVGTNGSPPVAELPEPVDPNDDWDAELDRIVAESVLAKLPEHHRTVLALRYMDDCSVPECAPS